MILDVLAAAKKKRKRKDFDCAWVRGKGGVNALLLLLLNPPNLLRFLSSTISPPETSKLD